MGKAIKPPTTTHRSLDSSCNFLNSRHKTNRKIHIDNFLSFLSLKPMHYEDTNWGVERKRTFNKLIVSWNKGFCFCFLFLLMLNCSNFIFTLMKRLWGLLWWPSGWESACQCRGRGFEPWSGRIPHAVKRPSPCTTTTEPVLWSPWATTAEAHVPRAHPPREEKPPQWETHAPQLRVAPTRQN